MSSNRNPTNGDPHSAHPPSLPGDGSQTSRDVKILLSSDTKILFPSPIRTEIVPPAGSCITLPEGGRIIFAGTLHAGGSFTLRGNSISSINTATSIVLGVAAVLSPRAGERITLSDGTSTRHAESDINLPVGAMIFFDRSASPRWRRIASDHTLSGEFITPPSSTTTLSSDVKVPPDTTVLLSENTFFPGGITLPGGVILSCGVMGPSHNFMPGGVKLPDNFRVPDGMFIPAGTSLLGGTTLPQGTTLQGGTILPPGFTIPEGTILG
ncbi:hypothetical protein F4776DRAFT_634208 [Hypoxylon sp. NC0597]|nr:hypothetical protein F4776DRAFT_634208 [Hypoxylon sp. NC0597]